jgi:hypothetical protein
VPITTPITTPIPIMRARRAAATALAITLGAALAADLGAQQQADLVAMRDKKLASPFLKNAAWQTDYDQARAAAKTSNKMIFAYFTRSFSP